MLRYTMIREVRPQLVPSLEAVIASYEMSVIPKSLTQKNKHVINIGERCNVMGLGPSKEISGLHHFTGSDYDGKFVGHSKDAWIKSLFEMNDSEIAHSFFPMGQEWLKPDTIPESIFKPLQRFLNYVY